MLRPFFNLFFTFILGSVCAQQHSVGFGVHTGFTIPFTIDKGIDTDPRYSNRYTLKGSPIGITFMKDYQGFGFVLSPGLSTIGQNYDIVNTVGGHNGERNINLRYFTVPFAFKLHLIDLEFFRVSALASISGAFLYGMDDKISHESTKLRFPAQSHPFLPDSYTIEYDGVLVPQVDRQSLSELENYNNIQVFAGVGLRSDWDVTNHWRVSFDFRVHYGLLDSRNEEYLERIKTYENIYDIPGKRNELYANFTVGIARFIDFDKSDKEREKKLKGSKKKYVPPKGSRVKTRKPGKKN